MTKDEILAPTPQAASPETSEPTTPVKEWNRFDPGEAATPQPVPSSEVVAKIAPECVGKWCSCLPGNCAEAAMRPERALIVPATPAAEPISDADILLVKRMITEALPKFNWSSSPLDANAIHLLNVAPAAFDRIILALATRPQGGAK